MKTLILTALLAVSFSTTILASESEGTGNKMISPVVCWVVDKSESEGTGSKSESEGTGNKSESEGTGNKSESEGTGSKMQCYPTVNFFKLSD
jgi:hypothetical protein